MWFTEGEQGRELAGPTIGRVTPDGKVTQFIIRTLRERTAFGTFSILAARDKSAIWFTEIDRIGRITMDGKSTEYALNVGHVGPIRSQFFVEGPNGVFYFDGAELSVFGLNRQIRRRQRRRTSLGRWCGRKKDYCCAPGPEARSLIRTASPPRRFPGRRITSSTPAAAISSSGRKRSIRPHRLHRRRPSTPCAVALSEVSPTHRHRPLRMLCRTSAAATDRTSWLSP